MTHERLHRPAGLHRVAGSRDAWVDDEGEAVTDAETLARLRRLALPPAWTHVWAAPDADSRVQATGVDSRGRTQYRYSDAAVAAASRDKFSHILDFADELPALRVAVEADLCAADLDQQRLTAVVVRLLDRGLFRVGNDRYARDNHTHGLTTLQRHDVAVNGDDLVFEFVGKEHLDLHIEVTDAASASLIDGLLSLVRADDELLFLTDEDPSRHVHSVMVNAYMHAHARAAASAKSFRTWGATVAAASVAGGAEFTPPGRRPRNADMIPVMAASHLLGNTPTVARQSYVHPSAIEVGRSTHVQDAVHRAAVTHGTAEVRAILHDEGLQRAVREALRDAPVAE